MNQLQTQLLTLGLAKLGTRSKPQPKQVRSSRSYSDQTISDHYNQQRMGYEFNDFCIPEFVMQGPWLKHRVKIIQSCPATWSRINADGDKYYSRRKCTFGESAGHSRQGDNYTAMEISNLYASELLMRDTFKALMKVAPTSKGASLDKKYKASLLRVERLWEPRQSI